MRPTLRIMVLDDLPAVFHLGERLFTSRTAPNLYRTWDEYEVTNLYQEDAETCSVAVLEDRVVGFALGTTVSKARSAWKYGYLVWLGVDPDRQRRGLATRLFSHWRGLMLASGVNMLLLDTEADNQAAIAFFRKMGFGNPEAHVYMTLNLAAEQRARRNQAEREGA
jgi:ribosomal protein S18 acetylase RimI-like enzyme